MHIKMTEVLIFNVIAQNALVLGTLKTVYFRFNDKCIYFSVLIP